MLICPKCKEPLRLEKNSYKCKNNHCFDKAKQGYVNLSLKQKASGDNKEMVLARTKFLEKGYYAFLRAEVDRLLEKIHPETLVDIGCGQGFYTRSFSEYAQNVIGVDLSKEAVLYAAKQDKKALYIVDSIYTLPLEDESVDCVVSIFTPIPTEEIKRVLKKGGYFIAVGPAKKHLLQLKKQLYDTVYENEEKPLSIEGFDLIKEEVIDETHRVKDVWDLFEMTPYRYKSPSKGMDKIKKLDELDVLFSFYIQLLQKQ